MFPLIRRDTRKKISQAPQLGTSSAEEYLCETCLRLKVNHSDKIAMVRV
jgi:hypothetical protein